MCSESAVGREGEVSKKTRKGRNQRYGVRKILGMAKTKIILTVIIWDALPLYHEPIWFKKKLLMSSICSY